MNIKTKNNLIQAANTIYHNCLKNPLYKDCDQNGCPFYVGVDKCALKGHNPEEWEIPEVEQEGI